MPQATKVGFIRLILYSSGPQDKCQGTTLVVPYDAQNEIFLAPQARAQRSGARYKAQHFIPAFAKKYFRHARGKNRAPLRQPSVVRFSFKAYFSPGHIVFSVVQSKPGDCVFSSRIWYSLTT